MPVVRSSAKLSMKRHLIVGGFGFSVVSLCVFATVAFGEQWMYENLGLAGAYIAWTILFILLGGGVLGSLVTGKWRLPRFYLLFAAAFFAYAAAWIVAYFFWRNAIGEWLGSIAGSILMAFVFAAAFGVLGSTIRLSSLLFVTNSIGYFLGSAINQAVGGRTGMLLWGVVYGFFLGTGIGLVLYFVQRTDAHRPRA